MRSLRAFRLASWRAMAFKSSYRTERLSNHFRALFVHSLVTLCCFLHVSSSFFIFQISSGNICRVSDTLTSSVLCFFCEHLDPRAKQAHRYNSTDEAESEAVTQSQPFAFLPKSNESDQFRYPYCRYRYQLIPTLSKLLSILILLLHAIAAIAIDKIECGEILSEITPGHGGWNASFRCCLGLRHKVQSSVAYGCMI